MSLFHVNVETPVGVLSPYVSCDDKQPGTLVAILWDGEPSRKELAGSHQCDEGDGPATLVATVAQLREYFAGGRKEFDLPLAPLGTDFQRSAWDALRAIPYGETSTYAVQAARIGRPSAVRAVGAANGRNPIPIVVPCHRVIGSNGSLTGFAGGIEAKRWLLDHEQFHFPA